MTDPRTVATYDAVAAEYRRRHADRTPIEPLIERFLDALPARDGSAAGERGAAGGRGASRRRGASRGRVLDLGCGPGWETAAFAARDLDVVGIDLTPSFLEAAREEAPDADLARMDMRRLGFASDSFDGAFALASFLHVPREDADATLAGVRRVLRDDGVLHLSVKRGEGEYVGEVYPEDDRRFTLYRPDDLRERVERAGFEALDCRREGEWVQLLARAGPSGGGAV
ncbi:class I SAM-dependent methyltransferase [Halomarina pelagica]|uniref:class I SAM-dependent methyltransferase n=1 Tax=Halomarina pelagica TaxID=2961599 RepID=UPI0020C56627|nr:class I SAM-dependent methyltransferase [Halomarina sp. BND7]